MDTAFAYGIWVVLVVTVAGLIMKFSTRPRVAEIGGVMFSWGLLVFLFCICICSGGAPGRLLPHR